MSAQIRFLSGNEIGKRIRITCGNGERVEGELKSVSHNRMKPIWHRGLYETTIEIGNHVLTYSDHQTLVMFDTINQEGAN